MSLPTENRSLGLNTSSVDDQPDDGRSRTEERYRKIAERKDKGRKEVMAIIHRNLRSSSSQGEHSSRRRRQQQPPISEPFFSSDDAAHAKLHDSLLKFECKKLQPEIREAIMRVLQGISTLVVLPRGSHKSLCYQLPAYLLCQRFGRKYIGIVVSPLKALLRDQVAQLPEFIRGVYLHSEQRASEREIALKKIMDGKVELVLMTPEQLMNRAYYTSLYSLRGNFPRIAFVCIDEVTCISTVTRPTYFRLPKVVRDELDVKCIIGLTATATPSTACSLAANLDISGKDIFYNFSMPENYEITASCEEEPKPKEEVGERDEALVQLLQSSRMSKCKSIIIYCRSIFDTVRVAKFLDSRLQKTDQDKKEYPASISSDYVVSSDSRKRIRGASANEGGATKKPKSEPEWTFASYHARMRLSLKEEIEASFMSGKLRVIVTTVALGMGIDKDNVKAVIHYNIPADIETYLQQIGRAGRNGMTAYCHIFVSESDCSKLSCLINGKIPEEEVIRKLIWCIVDVFQCSNERSARLPMNIMCKIFDTVSEDTTREHLETFLCYLEAKGGIKINGALTGKDVNYALTGDFSTSQLISMQAKSIHDQWQEEVAKKSEKLEELFEALKSIAVCKCSDIDVNDSTVSTNFRGKINEYYRRDPKTTSLDQPYSCSGYKTGTGEEHTDCVPNSQQSTVHQSQQQTSEIPPTFENPLPTTPLSRQSTLATLPTFEATPPTPPMSQQLTSVTPPPLEETLPTPLSDPPTLPKLLSFPGQKGKINIPNKIGPESSAQSRLDEKPRLAELKLMKPSNGKRIKIFQSVASKWQDVGILLDFDAEGDKLKLIAADKKLSPDDCCQQMFMHWLAGNGRPATWRVLIELLEDCDLNDLANQIRDALFHLVVQ